MLKADRGLVDELVRQYESNLERVELALAQLRTLVEKNSELRALYHSLKWRTKDPSHLRDKLLRKLKESRDSGLDFPISGANLFARINDLAGLRILHIHTHQIEQINDCLKRMFDEAMYQLIEGPIAKTWDDESRRYFAAVGIQTEDSATLYTSVHYVIQVNTRTPLTVEIQVRTLMEEVWGEVDHAINYPEPTHFLACREQIAALARATSACTRLVDSIFASHGDAMLTGRKLKDSKRRVP